MKHLHLKIFLLLIIISPNILLGQISGTKTIGATGDYATLQSAFNDINNLGLSGPLILEIQSDYNPVGESYPISPGILNGSSVINKVTLRPALGVSNIVLESNNTQTIDLNSTKYFTIDGRPGGSGNSQEIIISNSNPNANAIRFINESSYNEIKFCKIKGDEARSGGNTEFGVVNIGTSVGTEGNNNIIIDNCDVFNFSTGASRLIYIGGTEGFNNDSITISNCKLYNFVNRAIETSSIGVGDRLIITGNNIFEPLDLLSNNLITNYGIVVLSGGNHSIVSNYIGGQEVNCGGLPMSGNNISFIAISLNISISSSSQIEDNIIQNINLLGTSAFIGVEVISGTVNINENIIGSDTAINSIMTTSNFSGITAILLSGSGSINISSNLIANLNASGSGTSTNVRGIISFTGTGERNIINNTIHDLSTASSNTLANFNASVIGIGSASSNTSQFLSGNIIYNSMNYRVASTSSLVIGIIVTSGGGEISLNRTYGLSNTCTGAGATIMGIFGTNGIWSVINNQISLSNEANSNPVIIRGIRPRVTSGAILWKIYYNSVFIGGAPSSGAQPSSCLWKEVGCILDLKNNIFYNTRTGGTGKHYSMDLTNITNITSDYNLIIGESLNLVKWGTSDYNFSDYKINSNNDFSSFSNQPINVSSSNLFVNATLGNLNILSDNNEAFYCDGKGVPITGQSDDYNSTGVRNISVNQGTTDIGSDEFTFSGTVPNLTESASPALNSITVYSFGGRQLASITWGNTGTVPSGLTLTYNSGINPPGTLTGQYSKGYWDITATGGTGYSYDITLNYSPSILFNIINNDSLKIAKRDGGDWEYLVNSNVDTTNKTVSATGLTGFSQFALTSSEAMLPVELASFSSLTLKNEVILNWSTVSETNNKGFEVIRSKDKIEWTTLTFVNGAGSSNLQNHYQFKDKNLHTGRYYYRLKQIDYNGNYEFYNLLNEVVVGIPNEYYLSQNYPNPFNPSTKINYELPKDGFVSFKIYDVTGKQISELVNQKQSAGYYTINFNAINLSAGVYFYLLKINDFVSTKRMVLIK